MRDYPRLVRAPLTPAAQRLAGIVLNVAGGHRCAVRPGPPAVLRSHPPPHRSRCWHWAGPFGFVAADRGLKTRGPYAVVRHPMYASYLLLQSGYVLRSLSPWTSWFRARERLQHRPRPGRGTPARRITGLPGIPGADSVAADPLPVVTDQQRYQRPASSGGLPVQSTVGGPGHVVTVAPARRRGQCANLVKPHAAEAGTLPAMRPVPSVLRRGVALSPGCRHTGPLRGPGTRGPRFAA